MQLDEYYWHNTDPRIYKALRRLVRLGFVKYTPDGVYCLTDAGKSFNTERDQFENHSELEEELWEKEAFYEALTKND